MGLLYGANCRILTSTVFDLSTRVIDGQTDGRWHIRATAYTRDVVLGTRTRTRTRTRSRGTCRPILRYLGAGHLVAAPNSRWDV